MERSNDSASYDEPMKQTYDDEDILNAEANSDGEDDTLNVSLTGSGSHNELLNTILLPNAVREIYVSQQPSATSSTQENLSKPKREETQVHESSVMDSVEDKSAFSNKERDEAQHFSVMVSVEELLQSKVERKDQESPALDCLTEGDNSKQSSSAKRKFDKNPVGSSSYQERNQTTSHRSSRRKESSDSDRGSQNNSARSCRNDSSKSDGTHQNGCSRKNQTAFPDIIQTASLDQRIKTEVDETSTSSLEEPVQHSDGTGLQKSTSVGFRSISKRDIPLRKSMMRYNLAELWDEANSLSKDGVVSEHSMPCTTGTHKGSAVRVGNDWLTNATSMLLAKPPSIHIPRTKLYHDDVEKQQN